MVAGHSIRSSYVYKAVSETICIASRPKMLKIRVFITKLNDGGACMGSCAILGRKLTRRTGLCSGRCGRVSPQSPSHGWLASLRAWCSCAGRNCLSLPGTCLSQGRFQQASDSVSSDDACSREDYDRCSTITAFVCKSRVDRYNFATQRQC
jgi:hypothetical protein